MLKISQVIDKWFNRGTAAPPVYHVLVVSDDGLYLPYLSGLIEAQGHRVHCATDAAEALDLLAAMDLPDLIIFDFITPAKEARDLLERLRIRMGRTTTPPVLFLRDTPEDEEIAHELGADDVLFKPVDPAALGARVNQLAGRRRTDTV